MCLSFKIENSYWKQTKFADDITHTISSLMRYVPKDHPDYGIYLGDVNGLFRRVRYPYTAQNALFSFYFIVNLSLH